MLKGKTAEFASLFQEFTNSYVSTADGLAHIEAYEEQRKVGRQNFQLILGMARNGEDITEQVLLKLLPYTNTASNQQQGAWIHIAPAVQGNIRDWFEKAGWTKAEDWPPRRWRAAAPGAAWSSTSARGRPRKGPRSSWRAKSACCGLLVSRPRGRATRARRRRRSRRLRACGRRRKPSAC
jgi:hypothetical protein